MSPTIGIFWVYKGAVLGKARPLVDGNENIPGLLDTPDSHVGVWEGDSGFLATYPELRGTEYQTIPRGRVLYSQLEKRPIVSLDRVLFSPFVKHRIATFFRFNSA